MVNSMPVHFPATRKEIIVRLSYVKFSGGPKTQSWLFCAQEFSGKNHVIPPLSVQEISQRTLALLPISSQTLQRLRQISCPKKETLDSSSSCRCLLLGKQTFGRELQLALRQICADGLAKGLLLLRESQMECPPVSGVQET